MAFWEVPFKITSWEWRWDLPSSIFRQAWHGWLKNQPFHNYHPWSHTNNINTQNLLPCSPIFSTRLTGCQPKNIQGAALLEKHGEFIFGQVTRPQTIRGRSTGGYILTKGWHWKKKTLEIERYPVRRIVVGCTQHWIQIKLNIFGDLLQHIWLNIRWSFATSVWTSSSPTHEPNPHTIWADKLIRVVKTKELPGKNGWAKQWLIKRFSRRLSTYCIWSLHVLYVHNWFSSRGVGKGDLEPGTYMYSTSSYNIGFVYDSQFPTAKIP